MKRKVKMYILSGMLGVILTFGITAMGCKQEGCSNNGNCLKTPGNSTYCNNNSCAATKAFNAGTSGWVDCDCQ
jgi:hypothetical protein